MDEKTAVHTNKRYTIQCLSDSHDSLFFSQISSKSKKTFPWFIIQSVVEDISSSPSCLSKCLMKSYTERIQRCFLYLSSNQNGQEYGLLCPSIQSEIEKDVPFRPHSFHLSFRGHAGASSGVFRSRDGDSPSLLRGFHLQRQISLSR